VLIRTAEQLLHNAHVHVMVFLCYDALEIAPFIVITIFIIFRPSVSRILLRE